MNAEQCVSDKDSGGIKVAVPFLVMLVLLLLVTIAVFKDYDSDYYAYKPIHSVILELEVTAVDLPKHYVITLHNKDLGKTFHLRGKWCGSLTSQVVGTKVNAKVTTYKRESDKSEYEAIGEELRSYFCN